MQNGIPSVRACTRPVVYVAGPFRGKEQGNFWQIHQNIEHAATIALKVWEMGAACITPHLNTAPYQGALPDAVWLEGDLCILDKCDAIVMTTNWLESKGATVEHEYARMIGIPVFYECDNFDNNMKKLREYVNEFRRNSDDGSKSGNGRKKQGLRKSLRRLLPYCKAVPSS